MARQPDLRAIDTRATLGMRHEAAGRAVAEAASARIAELQGRLIGGSSRALLVVLQGTDASGKDGATRAIMAACNPMHVRQVGFARPSPVEAAHDFLWRVHAALPARGEIGVFNRSHYEDVVTVRVEGLAPERVWRPRTDAINAFERHLVREGTAIVKLLLWISPEEQLRRLEARRDEPAKRWKFCAEDIARRARWDAYVDAYQEMLDETSTGWAPWEVIPADRKWVRNARVLGAIAEALEAMELPELPPPPAPPGLGAGPG